MTIKFIDPISFLRTLNWDHSRCSDGVLKGSYEALVGNNCTLEHVNLIAELKEETITITVMVPSIRDWKLGLFFYKGESLDLDPKCNLIPLTIHMVKSAGSTDKIKF